ncbi:MAG: DegT/DnrJ/EryC1/StrS family aminotransferase, partial [Planctomycetota bacterium]
VYYPLPVHLQPCLESPGGKEGQFPGAEKACREVLPIPVYPDLTEAEQEHVIATIRAFYGAS